MFSFTDAVAENPLVTTETLHISRISGLSSCSLLTANNIRPQHVFSPEPSTAMLHSTSIAICSLSLNVHVMSVITFNHRLPGIVVSWRFPLIHHYVFRCHRDKFISVPQFNQSESSWEPGYTSRAAKVARFALRYQRHRLLETLQPVFAYVIRLHTARTFSVPPLL